MTGRDRRSLAWVPGSLAAMRLRAYNPFHPADLQRALVLYVR